MTLTPTTEQAAAVDLFGTGASLALQARAGTGKTSTLKLIAHSTTKRGQYLAFNRAIVDDAKRSMPGNITASTAHSLAFRTVGKRYQHRLNSRRMRSSDIARLVRVDHHVIRYGSQTKVLQPSYLGGLVMRALNIFCQTADPEPGVQHVPYIDGIDLPDEQGRRTYVNNNEVARHVLPSLKRAWADIQDLAGQLPFNHGHYLKIWQLGEPFIPAEFILFDEAQDANPVMLAAVTAQKHAQLIFVGDTEQAIYEFTGAVNALEKVPSDHTAFLTQSFRFGDDIAEQANVVLRMLGADPLVRGYGEIASAVAPVAEPDAILCRTNAAAVATVLEAQRVGQRPFLVGGGDEVVKFARAARELMDKGDTWHPDLACFDSWDEVRDYVANDENGGELKLLVSLVDEFGVDIIERALVAMPDERQASVVVSTAHKSKGREWGSVQLAGDFPSPKDGNDIGAGELRLLYVAVTRARYELDVTGCDLLSDPADSDDDDLALALPLPPIDETLTARELTMRFGTRGGGR